jgi:S-DNA-T family DNA segregation ATPase FtsK/SpoIIIE
MDLLIPGSGEHFGEMHRELDVLGEVLVEKLRTFNVESKLGGRTTGPVVTQFEVIPAPGVKVNRIANLDRDLALAMRAKTVRIVAPIPGKGAVGVEIPNPVPVTVQVREILESNAFQQSKADLPLALGKDLHGAPYVADLAKMPHCLIAGATGSGKSVCLNAIITSLAYRHTPETLRLLLIDPKMVELTTYGDLPHLRHPVVTDAKDTAGVLKWVMLEMDRRYALLAENGVRSIGEFNRRVRGGKPLRRVTPDGEEGDPDRWIYQEGILPFIVLVVDELADLMMTAQSEVEKPLTLLAQKARAIGVHLLVATQRPSVNVITGLIKANFPCRIAFRVASKTDSRTILDQNGADALLGNGDMLFLPPGQSSLIRMQGAFVSTDETARLIDWYRDRRDRELGEESVDAVGAEEDILKFVRAREAEDATAKDDSLSGDWDSSFREAAEVCIRSGQGSTSLLQRKLRIGYGRAARIVDQLHDSGVLGPPDGSKPREILMSWEQFDRMMSGQEAEG